MILAVIVDGMQAIPRRSTTILRLYKSWKISVVQFFTAAWEHWCALKIILSPRDASVKCKSEDEVLLGSGQYWRAD